MSIASKHFGVTVGSVCRATNLLVRRTRVCARTVLVTMRTTGRFGHGPGCDMDALKAFVIESMLWNPEQVCALTCIVQVFTLLIS